MDRLILASPQQNIERSFNNNLSNFVKIFNGYPGILYPVATKPSGIFEYMTWGYTTPQLGHNYLTISATNKIIYDHRFQRSIRQQRCIVPCNCFSFISKNKRFLVYNKNARLFSIAGIYTEFKTSTAVNRSFAILTEPASKLLCDLGLEEEPKIIGYNFHNRWITSGHLTDASWLLNSTNDCLLEVLPISNLINDTSLNFKEILRPIGDPIPTKKTFTDFFSYGSPSKKNRKVSGVTMTLEERVAYMKKKDEEKKANGL